MTRRALSTLFGVMLAAAAHPRSGAAQTTVTFDDRLPNIILGPYDGICWGNVYVGNPATMPAPSGYQNAIVSSPNIAYNGGGVLASILTCLPPGPMAPFTLNSGYFTAAWNDGLLLTAIGYNGSTQLFQQMMTLSTNGPTLETFNWTGLTRVDFVSSGGTPRFAFDATEFAMDNITLNAAVTTVTPEPASILLMGTGLLCVACIVRRKRQEHHCV